MPQEAAKLLVSLYKETYWLKIKMFHLQFLLTYQELCCDDALRVTVTKVMKPKELVLVLFLTNQKQANLVDVVTSIGQDISSNLKATLTNPHDNNTFLNQLSSFATVGSIELNTCCVCLGITNLTLDLSFVTYLVITVSSLVFSGPCIPWT